MMNNQVQGSHNLIHICVNTIISYIIQYTYQGCTERLSLLSFIYIYLSQTTLKTCTLKLHRFKLLNSQDDLKRGRVTTEICLATNRTHLGLFLDKLNESFFQRADGGIDRKRKNVKKISCHCLFK